METFFFNTWVINFFAIASFFFGFWLPSFRKVRIAGVHPSEHEIILFTVNSLILGAILAVPITLHFLV